jgi:magnesium-transporting ATPase (P-type)
VAEKPLGRPQAVLGFDDVCSGFALLGLTGMIDPPRDEAVRAVARCREAGVRVKMITGDHAGTARAVARQLGIGDGDLALTGADLDALAGREFDEAAAEVEVFARVSPVHKLRLVESLQGQGEVVAMTGDGVNDAPALKQADIGVAMGVTGTEVAKEAAEIVLLDDNFASIEKAIEEGRTVFDNLKKTILFILPTNGGECLTLLVAILTGTALPILPLHILWINLVTTVALAITLAYEPPDGSVMRRPPHAPGEPLLSRSLVWRIAYVSVLMAGGAYALYYLALGTGHAEEVARCVAVNAIVCFEAVYVVNSRRLTGPVLNRAGLTGNRVLWAGIGTVLALQLAFTYWPAMNRVFGVAPVDAWMWLQVAAASAVLFLLVEAEKAVSRRRAARRGITRRSPRTRRR